VNIDPTLSDPRDVHFALRAVLGPDAAPQLLREAAAALGSTPTLPQIVDAALARGGAAQDPAARARACALLAACFELDPPADPDPRHSP
jgi:hypothetical protein